MDDSYELEEQAAELYRQGEYTSAREIFERLSQATRSDSLKDIYKFNISSCYASEDNYTEAMNRLVELKAFPSQDFESLYNKAVCLIRLGKADLALSILDIMAWIKERDEISTRKRALVVQLLINCMKNLAGHNLNRSQCEILERLLIEYKSQIIANYGENMWVENLGHVLFLADTRFDDCLKLYESLLDDGDEQSGLLHLDPMVLSNLCVSYILTGRNGEAEELIKDAEDAEESDYQSSMFDKSQLCNDELHGMSHLTHLNLAIGTLYCVKGNHEFGLTRIFKSLEPIDRKLTTQSWYQARKCILSTLDKHCKQLIYIRDELFDQMIAFLIQCETHGIYVRTNDDETRASLYDGRNSVTYEARYLRSIVLTLIHD